MALHYPTPRWGLFAIFALFCTVGCERRPTMVLVGHLAPLSGPDRERGLAAVRGAQLAVDEINDDKEQWIAGHRIAVIHADTKGDPVVAENQAVRLATINKVPALIGGDTHEQMTRLLATAHEYSLTLIGTAGAAGASSNAFALGLSLEQRVDAIAKLLAGEPKGGKVVILADGRDAGITAAADQLAKALAGTTLTVSMRSFKDRSTLYQTMGKIGDGALIFFGDAKDFAVATQIVSKPRLLIFAGDEAEAHILCDEPTANGSLMLSAMPATPQTPAAKMFCEKYKKKFSGEPPLEAARAYDAVRFFSQSAREAKSLTFEKLAPKLKAIQNGDRLSGAYAIGPDQVARGTAYVLKIDNGRLVDHDQFAPAAEKKSP